MSGPQASPLPIEPEKNWFARHWIVTIAMVVTLAGLGFVAAVFFGIMSLLRSSDVYKEAVSRAQHAPAVVQALGEPVQPGWWFTGNNSVNGPSGSADIAIPVSGTKGKGTVYAVARKQAGQWQFKVLEVAIDGQPRRIPLVSPQLRIRDQ